MSKPLLALTPGHNMDSGDVFLRPTYLKAIAAAGAVPVMLPLEASPDDYHQISESFDGFLFTGGPDTHPFLFGEDTYQGCGSISPKRDSMELSLLPHVMKAGKPILGICRGIQIINIGLGGTIYQDISNQYYGSMEKKPDCLLAHRQPYGYELPSHTVTLAPESLLAGICGCRTIKVNSMHHQAVKKPASGLAVCATASDGLIEAVEMPDYPWLAAVQWHPEYLWETDPAAASLFRCFVEACIH